MHQPALITAKAGDNGAQHRVRVEPLQIQGVTGVLRHQQQKRKLGASIALAKGMNGIELGEKMRSLRRESVRGKTGKQGALLQVREQRLHGGIDIFRIAEPVAALGDPYSPILSCPIIDILEQISMDGAIMGRVEGADRQRLRGPLGGDFRFEGVELSLRCQVEAVVKYRGAGIAVGSCSAAYIVSVCDVPG